MAEALRGGEAGPAEPEAAKAKDGSTTAMNNGLWDAVEELRTAKSSLQAQLRAAERRSRELEGELSELRSGQVRSATPSQDEAAAAEALNLAKARLQAAESRARDLEGELTELRSTQARSASAPGQGRPAELSSRSAAVAEAEAESLRDDKKRLAAENSDLRQERASLQQRLDVFYQAIEFEKASGGADKNLDESCPSDPSAGPKAGLLQQVENMHSRLILESVTLRNEVSRLKKKKWVLRAVLANGGENEQRAIEEEVALSRAAKAERRSRTPAAQTPADVGLDI